MQNKVKMLNLNNTCNNLNITLIYFNYEKSIFNYSNFII